MRRILPALALIGFLSGPAPAEVVRVEIDSRRPVLDGRTFGEYGPYELVSGRVLFAFDPFNPYNERVVDLALAPRGEEGSVEAWANFVALVPERGRDVLLVEVSNRGGKFSPRYFNRASSSSLESDDPGAWGDGLLMRLGLTVLWVGWQWDVPDRQGALRLHVPRARRPAGSALTGLVRADWVVDEPAPALEVAHRGHRPYPVADPDDPANVLTVRDGREAPRRVVPRDRWRWARVEEGRVIADSTSIVLEGSFEAGKIYELVYRAEDPAVAGLGLAAIRDVAAYAKHDPGSIFPARLALAAGVSQTGRFLRHFLYQGFNTDEAGRKAYDGLYVITAGAGRGSFNHRFAQPSRDAHRYSAFFYPTDLFPFTSRVQRDTLAWRSDGLLARLHDPAHAPRTFYVNTGYEYWGRAGSLIHTSVSGKRDVEQLPHERLYHLASAQHFPWRFPPPERTLQGEGVWRGNPLDFSVNYRALLVRLVEWLDGEDPPPSAHPRISDGTLVPIERAGFPAVPNLAFPETIHVAYRADYGPRWDEGIVDVQPPAIGPAFPSRVSRVDSLGNEVAGVRNVEIRVPLATYTPWNLRVGAPGATDELTDFFGSFAPLPRTERERAAASDPRPAVESLYEDRAAFLAAVREAAEDLVEAGFLLAEDRERVVARQEEIWRWLHGGEAAGEL